MINRRKAVVGFATYRLARMLARRKMRRAKGDGGRKMRNGKSVGAGVKAAALVEAVRPIVTKAMNDPELHEAVRKAFATGKDVQSQVKGQAPAAAAKKIAADKKLQKKVESSAQDLQKAVAGLVEKPKKKGRLKKLVGRVAVIGAVAGGTVVVLKKLRRGGGGDDAY